MEKIVRVVLFCIVLVLVQGCTPAKRAPTLTSAEEDTYMQPNNNMDYIYRGPPAGAMRAGGIRGR